jgi:transposase
MPLYGGIDRHANNSVIVLLNEPDEVIYRKRLPNELSTILAQLAPYHTALNWYWFVDGLMEADSRVHLANRLPRCIGEIFGGRLQLSVYKGIADT